MLCSWGLLHTHRPRSSDVPDAVRAYHVRPLVNCTADAFQQLIKKKIYIYFLNSFGCS